MTLIDKLKNIGVWIAIILFCLICLFFFAKGCKHTFFPGDTTGEPKTVIMHDTTTVERYNVITKRDTVIKWYEKIIEKKSDPVVIYRQKVDTVFIEKTKDMDVMLNVKKRGNELDIFAVNQNGKVIKQYTYKNIGNDFNATSQTGNVFVKTKLFYWNGVAVLGGYELQLRKHVKLDDGSYFAGIKSGINYLQIINLDAAINYNFITKEPSFRTDISYKFIK